MEEEEEQTSTKKTVPAHVPMKIGKLQFGILSQQEVVQQAVVQIGDRRVYQADFAPSNHRKVAPHGPLDERMGVSGGSSRCKTCDQPVKECNGHFGYVKLALPCFHVGFIKKVVEVLHCICKECSAILLAESAKREHTKALRRPGLDSTQKGLAIRKVITDCRKMRECPACGSVQGTVKRVSGHTLKIIHDKFRHFNQSTSKSKKPPKEKVVFDASFEVAKKTNLEINTHYKRVIDDLDPLRVYRLFRRIRSSDIVLLGMDGEHARPESLIWQYIPAPPVNIRPSVAQESASTEDDITNKLGDIIQVSNLIRTGLMKGQPITTIQEQWDYLQIQLGMYINSDVPGLQQSTGKRIRGFSQRLKGKQGRFRGNLSGKRVDFSGRTVISPDPNLGIDEVAVPQRVATILTYPERVTEHNMDRLRQRIMNGEKWPGASFVLKKNTNRKTFIKAIATGDNREEGLRNVADELSIGDVVDRHLDDGDIVLFNRQPSLHRVSIMAHKAKVLPHRTFRLNECVCTPYNADFDGDEMNLHVPQTEEARTEALELMGVKHNLSIPKDGTPIIAAIQDFITAACLLGNKDQFFDRDAFSQICSMMFDGTRAKDIKSDDPDGEARDVWLKFDMPEPTIVKPRELWTGKQIFNVLIRPNKDSGILVNMEGKCRQYSEVPDQAPDMNEDDAYLVIQNSELMCGVLDKGTIGSGRKDTIFYVLNRDFGPDCTVQAMNRLAKLCARWLTLQGFSIGIDDVYPSENLAIKKQELIEKAYAQCDELIAAFKAGHLQRDAGCDEEMTLEHKISGILSRTRQDAGALCFQELSRHNAAIIMANSGSKGSNINVSQMVAAVGQQVVGSQRVADGFQDRTLPHFPKAARQPPSKGFVRNSFFSGLTPTEFFFHAITGREGLVDTAVKTAETGYMSRRLMKSLEDMSVQYDDTVRTASSHIVQFLFGDDGMDPIDMESKAKPVNFERTWTHALSSTWVNEDKSLESQEITNITNEMVETHLKKYERKSLTGKALDYEDASELAVDQFESGRNFIRDVQGFVGKKQDSLARVRASVEAVAAVAEPSKKQRSSARAPKSKKAKTADTQQLDFVESIAKLSERALQRFLHLCFTKYEKAKVQPGLPVGALASQSIGEPGTQMTLKTFHFAGVAGMSLNSGVPRIKEIINGSKAIKTPIIKCELNDTVNERAARIVKSRIEKTYLRDVMSWIEEVWDEHKAYLHLQLDIKTIDDLYLDVSIWDVKRAIIKSRALKLTDSMIRCHGDNMYIFVDNDSLGGAAPKRRATTTSTTKTTQDHDPYLLTQALKRALPHIVVKGYPDASRAVITHDTTAGNALAVEGYGLARCMATPGINPYATRTNSVLEIQDVLGIEAARSTIIDELHAVIAVQLDIDPRHIALLADVMTFRGQVLGITRFGLTKTRDSVLHLASFEKTPDQLFDAAVRGKADEILGVSESIILGQTVPVGTGALGVVRPLHFAEGDLSQGTPYMGAFEGAWTQTFGAGGKRRRK